MEIIPKPNPHCLSLASHCQDPLCLPLACLLCLSHSVFSLYCTCTDTHTHTGCQTVETQAPSISVSPYSVVTITSLSASLSFIHKHTRMVSSSVSFLRPSLVNPAPCLFLSPIAQENLLRMVHIEYSMKGKRDLLKHGRVSSKICVCPPGYEKHIPDECSSWFLF